jgi:hypothetical protein
MNAKSTSIFGELATNLRPDEREWFLHAIDAPDNSLFDLYIRPRLLVDGAYYTYTARSVAEEDQRHAWNPSSTSKLLSLYGIERAQSGFAVFTNPLGWPDYDASTGRWAGPPSERPINAGYCVYTYEVDKLAGGNKVDLVHYMIDVIRGGAVERLDESLRRYFDYRGYTVVYSGSKSFHIHLVFDLRHLSRELAFKGNSKYKARWTSNVPAEYLRDAHKEYFKRLRVDLDTAVGEHLDVHENLARWEQLRRCPYGLRQATEDNPLGVPEQIDGNEVLIPQLVVQSRISSKSPYGASHGLHVAEDMIEIAGRAMKAAKSDSSCRAQNAPAALGLGEDPRLSAFFEHALPEGMSLAGSRVGPGGVEYRFHNDLSDITPSSLMRGEHDGILVQGQNRLGREVIDIGVSADQIHRDLRDMPERPSPAEVHWFEKLFREAAINPETARVFLSNSLPNFVGQNRRVLVKAPEGIGKSSALIRGMDRVLARVEGQIAFVSPSYVQAQEKLDEFNRHWTALGFQGFLLESVSHLYGRLVKTRGVSPISRIRALEIGYTSWLRCIEEQQLEIFSAMLGYRQELLHLRSTCQQVVLFGVHDVVEQFQFAPLSWAFYTEEFEQFWQGEAEEGTSVKTLAQQNQPRLVVFDELTPKDLLYVHGPEEVEWVQACLRSSGGWEGLSEIDRYSAYQRRIRQTPCEGLSWEKFREIAFIGYGPEDMVPVDIQRELPFDDRTGMYGKCHGDVVYLKQRNWWGWFDQVVILTTEQLPAEILRQIGRRARPSGATEDQFIILELEPNPEAVDRDVVFVERNRLCTKSKLRKLALYHRKRNPGVQLISDMMQDPEVRTHYSAKGRNDLAGSDIVACYTAVNTQQYRELSAINTAYGLRSAVRLTYVDKFNQTSGRNKGYRGRSQKDHTAVMTHRLYKWLLVFLYTYSRYEIIERKPEDVVSETLPDEAYYTWRGVENPNGHPVEVPVMAEQ